jgi:hypothetical protein
MNERRHEIDTMLKTTSVPLLREMGFKGSFPHFYRSIREHVDLLTFQFRRDGSGFVVEISCADPGRQNVYFRPETTVAKLRTSATTKRYRLGQKTERGGDGRWFELTPGAHEAPARHFKKLAFEVNDLIVHEAAEWWEAQRHAA